MPLSLVWGYEMHSEHAPKLFLYLKIVSSIALLITAFLSFKKQYQLASTTRKIRIAQNHVLPPKIYDEETFLALVPFLFAFVSWACLFDLKHIRAMQVVTCLMTAYMLRSIRNLLLEILGDEPELSSMIQRASPASWWKTPPCCCLAGPCLTKEEEPLQAKHIRFAKFMTDFYCAINMVAAIVQLEELGEIRAITKTETWCVAKTENQAFAINAVIKLQALSAPFAMYSINVLSKAVSACVSNGTGSGSGLHVEQKGKMAGNISVFTGLLAPLIANVMSKIGFCGPFASPVLAEADTIVKGAAGCAVYDASVMHACLVATAVSVLMIPVARSLEDTFKARDDSMADNLREKFLGAAAKA
eukprot:TRINITY_DN65276_c0_g1_i1.p1 TRINITY_DN65276_c0_g1~~TRINITY_DN65276_c0_g1_i1.p1  ORF type:complete len:359 (-),score=49.90 TRINITY_DN65276_c0_g1_i1:70-1146(-)